MNENEAHGLLPLFRRQVRRYSVYYAYHMLDIHIAFILQQIGVDSVFLGSRLRIFHNPMRLWSASD